MKIVLNAICLAAVMFVAALAQPTLAQSSARQAAMAKGDLRVVVKTTKGEIHGVLFATKTPVTVANFVNLVERKFYDGMVFHRVIPNFMVQVGDPLSKDPRMEARWGTGGPGYKFNDEIVPALKHDRPGIFSMANAGKNRLTGAGTNGSQIFITHLATPWLDGKHTVFGNVVKGQEVVNKLAKGDKILQVQILDDTKPLKQSQAKQIAEWNKVLNVKYPVAKAAGSATR
jgi:peptidyl-prolyl cis-trans isomerase B (cyclophilin B)